MTRVRKVAAAALAAVVLGWCWRKRGFLAWIWMWRPRVRIERARE